MLVCFALKEEASAFQRLTRDHAGLSIRLTGIGKPNAEKAVRNFFTTKVPDFVLTCGFAGGLDPNLAIGTVVFTTEDQALAASLASARATPARFHCATRIAITIAEKQELRRTTRADVVEMESEAIQAVCREFRIPCATVRVISDTANENLPLDFNQLSNPDQSLNFGKLAWAIAKSPGKIPALMQLQKNSRLAAENLARVLVKVIAAR